MDKQLFYIYTPAIRLNSAGIRVLHYLCDALNQTGQEAWLVLHNPKENLNPTDPELNTPIISQEQVNKHLTDGRTPTVIYSETVPGNPLKAKRVIRYLLHFPGALGGTKKFPDSEWLIAYSKRIMDSVNNCNQSLFLPAIKISELPPIQKKDPNLHLMYAGKYRAFVGEPEKPTNLDLVEIHRDGPQRQPRSEVLDLLSKASSIYVWENSSISTEAVLLGTVCVFVPNPFLGELIADFELGRDGISTSLEQSEIDKARESLPRARLKYLEAQRNFENQLHLMIKQHEVWVKSLPIQESMKIPIISYTINRHRIRLFFSMLKHEGIRKTFRVVKEFGYLRIK
jgi:O-antigen biosynthesis protein